MPNKLWPFDKNRRRQQQANPHISSSSSSSSSAVPRKDNNNNKHYATSLESTLGTHSKHSSKSDDELYERGKRQPRTPGESSSSSIINSANIGGGKRAATTTADTANSSTSNIDDINGKSRSHDARNLVNRLFHGKRWLQKETEKAASHTPGIHPTNSQLSYVSNVGGTDPSDEEGLERISSDDVRDAAPLLLNRITSTTATKPTSAPLAKEGVPLPSSIPPGSCAIVNSPKSQDSATAPDANEERSSTVSSSRLEPLPSILTINTDNKPIKVTRQRYRNFHIRDLDVNRQKNKHTKRDNEPPPKHYHRNHHHHYGSEPSLAAAKERCQRVYLSRSQYDSHSSRFRKYIEKRKGDLRSHHHHGHGLNSQEEPEVVTDALIENQRGLLFFNVPFFTAALLQQGDCPAWMNREGQATAVDIYSAQLPDAMWKWEWSRWYVDMRPDVDEHGWAYSLRFGSSLWHGKPVFFHSFVRRRIWLRQRSRIPCSKACNVLPVENESFFSYAKSREIPASGPGTESNTLLPSLTTSPTNLWRNRSRDSFYYNPQQQGLTPSVTNLSTLNLVPTASTIDSVLDKDESTIISDVPNLMLALRCAFIDRERINAFDEFLQNAGQDLMHLPRIILDVLGTLEFQDSRHHALDHLVQFRSNAQRNNEFELTRFYGLQPEALIHALDLAIDKAKQDVGKLDFYVDKQHNHAEADDGKHVIH